MTQIKAVLNSPYFFWLILSIPSFRLVANLFNPTGRYGMIMHVSGEFSTRFLVISLIITPLMLLSGGKPWARWLLRRRRYIGIAAFGYALLHTIFYIRHEKLHGVLAEWADPGILTGWLAFLIFVPLALTSNNASVRAMGPSWKNLQRAVYFAALFTFLHWGLIGHWPPAIVHALPVVAFTLYRLWRKNKKASNRAAIPADGVTGNS